MSAPKFTGFPCPATVLGIDPDTTLFQVQSYSGTIFFLAPEQLNGGQIGDAGTIDGPNAGNLRFIPRSASAKFILTLACFNNWNDAAPTHVILDAPATQVIEALSRLEEPCRAFNRTLPDRVLEFAFDPPISLHFTADSYIREILNPSALPLVCARVPDDFAQRRPAVNVETPRLMFDGTHWMVSGAADDSSDLIESAGVTVDALRQAAQQFFLPPRDVANQARIQQDILAELRSVEAALSPENLAGDGGLSRAEVRRRKVALTARRFELIEQLGHEPTKQELWPALFP